MSEKAEMLGKAKFLSERESKERELIIKCLPNLDEIGEWQILLSDWKIEKSVTEITDWQAKRFSQYLLNKNK